ncbi:MAG TPA: hypothetical protein VNH46_12135, partial [Gemmatimonadales bacterium]|nr:hypothetical protein [Gemmatimonadales bacterium]
MSPAARLPRWSRRLPWLLVPGLLGSPPARAQTAPPTLHLEEIIADSESYHVLSTLIIGPTEVICFDTQNRLSDG